MCVTKSLFCMAEIHRRRVRGQDLRGAKAMELGRTPSLDTMQGERDSYQILLQVKLAFPPSPQI